MATNLSPVPVVIIACGALSRELKALVRTYEWRHVTINCLPAKLHNHPQLIPQAVRDRITLLRRDNLNIFVAYGDCGTGGELDRVLLEEKVERLPGAHCYSFLSGEKTFDEIFEQEPGTFFLTDFLTRHFDRLVINGLGLDKNPELLPVYFGNYTRMVYLAQQSNQKLFDKAREAADKLGLALEIRETGLQSLAEVLLPPLTRRTTDGKPDYGLLA